MCLFTPGEAFLALAEAAIEVEDETGAHVFIEYSPHVNQIDIRVYPNRWANGGSHLSESERYWWYLDYEDSVGEAFLFIASLPRQIEAFRADSSILKEKRRQALLLELCELDE